MTHTASTLDVIARSLDLCRSLMDASNSTSPVVNAIMEVGQWLGREKLSKFELQDCLQKARGIALPNSTAQILFEDIRSGIDASDTAPFIPRSGGSLGSLMANDPNLCWMVSTVACLFQFHEFYDVTECVKDFILASQPRGREIYWDDVHDCPCYHPSTVHLGRVVDKIVSSIWFNVVNSKCNTMELPEELLSVCHVGHNLKGPRFGKLLHSLRANRSKIMIKSEHFLRNVTLWLLLHFDGRLVIVVSGKILYDKRLGQSQREIELRVRLFCGDCHPCPGENLKYELFEDIAGNLNSFLSGNYVSSFEFPERPMVRRKLYEIPDIFLSGDRDKRHSLQVRVKCTAQGIIRWLLAITVIPPYEFTNFGFSVVLDESYEQDRPCHKIKDILAQSPNILNLRWGNQKIVTLVYAEPLLDQSRTEDEGSEGYIQDPMLTPESTYAELLPYFPVLQDLLEEARPLCKCPNCYETDSSSPTLLPGCLRHDVLVDCLVFLAHGVADGFGVSDASGVSNLNVAAQGVLQLLLDLVKDRGILWDTWFGVAASVFLGCPCPFLPLREYARHSETTIAAVQYGDLAVIAPWLDIARELKIERSFRLAETRGKLSIARASSQDEWQYRAISENYAIIETERTESTSSQRSKASLKTIRPDAEFEIPPDESLAETDWILIQADESQYRIMMRVRSSNHSRIVDPSDAMIRLVRHITRHKCEHMPFIRSPIVDGEQAGILYPFSDLLGNWEKWDHSFRFIGHNPNRLLGDSDSPEAELLPNNRDTIYVTKVLESYVKQNLAYALSVNENVILNNGSACFPCLLQEASKAQSPHPDLERPPGDRYIINVRKSLQHNSPTTRVLTLRAGTNNMIEASGKEQAS